MHEPFNMFLVVCMFFIAHTTSLMHIDKHEASVVCYTSIALGCAAIANIAYLVRKCNCLLCCLYKCLVKVRHHVIRCRNTVRTFNCDRN